MAQAEEASADPACRFQRVIVSKALANALATGRATQLRRLIPKQSLVREQHTYSVMPGPGRPAECRVTVLRTRVAPCSDLTYQDARAMGYRTSGEAKAAWVRERDQVWMKRELVELAEVFDDGCSVVDWILVRRFDTYWAHRFVQVATVKRVVDEPRFLADQRRANAGQYVRSPARSIDPSAECPDEAWQERHSAKVSAQGDELRRRQVARARAEASSDWSAKDAARGAALAARRVEQAA